MVTVAMRTTLSLGKLVICNRRPAGSGFGIGVAVEEGISIEMDVAVGFGVAVASSVVVGVAVKVGVGVKAGLEVGVSSRNCVGASVGVEVPSTHPATVSNSPNNRGPAKTRGWNSKGAPYHYLGF